ncbi:MAG TPA: hypothetical protein VMV97_07790 [Sulfuriferula sp.]|nr:hypothetical protein [Sulfuriferula sp.]
MKPVRFINRSALASQTIRPALPMWKVVPTHDENGKMLTDFMMLLPKLRQQPKDYIERTVLSIEAVLAGYREVVFADVNLSINVLWVSLRHRSGAVLEIAGAIRSRVPEALLVGHYTGREA